MSKRKAGRRQDAVPKRGRFVTAATHARARGMMSVASTHVMCECGGRYLRGMNAKSAASFRSHIRTNMHYEYEQSRVGEMEEEMPLTRRSHFAADLSVRIAPRAESRLLPRARTPTPRYSDGFDRAPATLQYPLTEQRPTRARAPPRSAMDLSSSPPPAYMRFDHGYQREEPRDRYHCYRDETPAPRPHEDDKLRLDRYGNRYYDDGTARVCRERPRHSFEQTRDTELNAQINRMRFKAGLPPVGHPAVEEAFSRSDRGSATWQHY